VTTRSPHSKRQDISAYTSGRRAFSVAGLAIRNSLPDDLHDPANDSEHCQQDLIYIYSLEN